MLFLFYLIISVDPIDFGPMANPSPGAKAFSCLINSLIRSLDYFRLFQPRPAGLMMDSRPVEFRGSALEDLRAVPDAA
jgi:hypothetical protein